MISESLKKIIEGYMNNSELADIETAEVLSINPIKVKLGDLAEPLESEFLIVPERLIKETYEIEVPQLTVKHTCSSCNKESHNIQGMGVIKVKNVTLKVGDRVTLLKAKGGQKYFILDKVVEYDTTRRINHSI